MEHEQQKQQSSLVLALAAAFCCLLWGSAFSGVMIGYGLLHIEGGRCTAELKTP